MFERRTLQRLTIYVLGASAVLVSLAFALGGVSIGLGALAGAGLGAANWMGMRWVAERLMHASDKGKAVWGSLLVVKMALTLGLTWAVLATGAVHPLGFAIGLSGLVLGLLGGAFQMAASTRSSERTEES